MNLIVSCTADWMPVASKLHTRIIVLCSIKAAGHDPFGHHSVIKTVLDLILELPFPKCFHLSGQLFSSSHNQVT